MIKYCTDLSKITISVHHFQERCGYCKNGKEAYNEKDLAPKGFCIDAYYTVYPYLLALLYDANFNRKPYDKNLTVSCPNIHNPILIKITFTFKKFKTIINLIEKLSRRFGLPKDAIDKIIKLEVMNDNGHCNLKKGYICNIKIPDIREFCPASFFSIYPLIHLYQRNNFLIQDKAKHNKISFVCPDPKTNVGYDVDLSASSIKNNFCAFIPNLAKFKIVKLGNTDCKIRYWTEKEVTLDKIFLGGICPFIFNIAIPYVITFQNGGYFKWSKNLDTVEAQCPIAMGGVEFEIKNELIDRGRISLLIKRIRGYCPNGHKEGQIYHLDFSKIICIHIFARIFPYLLLLEHKSGIEKHRAGISVSCPFQKKNTSYLLIREK